MQLSLEFVVSLLSSFQIYHQSVPNVLASLPFNYSTFQLSMVSASFPGGKFVGTAATVPLYLRYSNHLCLDISAVLLTIGAAIMILPSCLFLCVGRCVIGCGTGIAFVASTVAIRDCTAYESRPRAFATAASLFSVATMFPNVLVMLRGASHFTLMLLLATPALASGLLYFKERNRYLEPTEEPKEQVHDGSSSCIPFVLMALNAVMRFILRVEAVVT
ncbi:Protein F25D1.2 [Aphelenchoides avenae]|nr:Protein F25D1.2 [Aphelenchus avenae]